ncbi:MAG: HAMP domain-containing protein [Candidatus Hydrogenedentes bacterium]|nr:HAMP domain-containing protein [Candidatus Hydrogenedentota bacterium]
MPLKPGYRLWDSFKLRLALISAGIFAIATLLSFSYLYRSLATALEDRVDDSLRTESKEFTDIYLAGGIEALRKEVAFEQEASGKDEVFMRVFDGNGKDLASSDLSYWGRAPFAPGLTHETPSDGPILKTVRVARDGSEVRCIRALVASGVYVSMGYTLRENAALLARFRSQFMNVLAVMLGLCTLGAWFVAKRAMSGVEAVTHTAAQIAAGELDSRVHLYGHGYEIRHLADTFNKMLDRIAVLVVEIRQISENVAHELRSPITRIRGNAEVTLMSSKSLEDYRELTGSIIEECDGLLALMNTMLDISELEGGVARIAFEPVDIADLVRGTCELFQPAAEDSGIQLKVCAESTVMIRGDGRMLGQVLVNLLDNAMKYTPRGGAIEVSVNRLPNHVLITVDDTGIGIVPEDVPHIFDRFFRGSNRLSKPGTGLGLGLAKAVVNAHGGLIEVTSAVGKGTRCSVLMPVDS